jgi:hypothetical protein
MALTTDNLTTVEGLTTEQTAAIIALSEKDSELVAKKAAGEATSTAYGLVDEALKAVTGKEKPGGVFTTDHLKSTLSQLKSASESGNAKTLKAELDDVKAKYEALQKEKAAPGDVARITELERDLKDATAKLENLQSKYTEDLEAWKTKNDEALKANENIRAAAVIDRDLEGFTYRDDIDASVVDIVRKAAREELMSRPRKWVKGEDGKETLVFLDDNGMVVNNPKTITPATPDFLLTQKLGGVIVQGKKATGAGSGTPNGTPSGGGSDFSLEGVGSKEAGSRKLADFVTNEKGLSPGTKQWQDAFDEIYRDTVAKADLPTKEPVAA